MRNNYYITIVLIVTGFSFLIYASSGGITGVTKKNGTGCTCHGSMSSAVTVSITGPDTLLSGETGTYSVVISGGPLTKAGTDIAASEGTLTPASGSGLQKINGELTHISPKAPSGGVVTFQFTYTAPAQEGTYTLYAAGNSVNGNGNNGGDEWNFAVDKAVAVSAATGVNDEQNILSAYRLNQNYPNPFNPTTSISFNLAQEGFVSLKIYDALGNEAAELINENRSSGEYTVRFDASSFASGVYYYTLKVNNFTETKKMILEK